MQAARILHGILPTHSPTSARLHIKNGQLVSGETDGGFVLALMSNSSENEIIIRHMDPDARTTRRRVLDNIELDAIVEAFLTEAKCLLESTSPRGTGGKDD